jgi:glycosyltransferase involved in cell wall biosynthesis
MINPPFFSIIIPTYNRANILHNTAQKIKITKLLQIGNV